MILKKARKEAEKRQNIAIVFSLNIMPT